MQQMKNQHRYKSNWIQKCACFRAISLEIILLHDGAKQDIHDRRKWHTIQGPISITGPQFFNWQCNYGGGGAIDLVMHLKDCDFSAAIAYLNIFTPNQSAQEKQSIHCPTIRGSTTCKKLLLPAKNKTLLPQVASYLIKQRKLPKDRICQAIESGIIYADSNANVVFLMRGKGHAVIGAELRGTTHKKWRGIAPGSDKQKGAFYVGSPASKVLCICESAIDALSYSTLFPDTLAISTAGATPRIAWIDNFILKGFQVICAFDNDDTGNQIAGKMMRLYPVMKRHSPKEHDWNDVLRKSKMPS
jgi:hypothetical protein